jgi:hypothetical protein
MEVVRPIPSNAPSVPKRQSDTPRRHLPRFRVTVNAGPFVNGGFEDNPLAHKKS